MTKDDLATTASIVTATAVMGTLTIGVLGPIALMVGTAAAPLVLFAKVLNHIDPPIETEDLPR